MKTQPLPPEFLILGYRPEPFTMAESMAISGYMALSFAEGLVGDILFHELKSKLSAARLAELRVGTRHDATEIEKSSVPVVPSSKPKTGSIPTPSPLPTSTLAPSQWVSDAVTQLERDFGLFQGSNSWVMSPKRSKSGQAILANDPHIAYMNPSVFYEASLHTATLELYGHFLPLVPFPVLAHDAVKAWAITMSESDDVDIYKEKINQHDHNSIWFEQKWTGLESEEELIKVKGSSDVKIVIKISPHGPMLIPEDSNETGEKFSNKIVGTDKNYYSVKWTYYHPDNHVSSAFYKLMRATNITEFKDALALAASPGLNVSWADKDGHIAWWVMGKIPKLPPGTESDTVLEGDSGRHEYLGYLSIDENPHEVDPASGVIVSANYRPQVSAYASLDGYWQPSDRYVRISELLARRDKWSLEELKAVQTDHTQFQVPKFIPIMLASLKLPSKSLVPPVGNNYQKLKRALMEHPRSALRKKLEQQAMPLIRAWNGQSKIESVGASIYHSWMKYIGREAIIDELGESDFLRFARLADYRHFYKWLLANADSIWWDDLRTPEIKESREDILFRAYTLAIASLDERFGDKIDHWWWGRLHAVEYQHFLGRVKPLNYIFNVGPYMSPGGTHEVNAVAYPRHEDTFFPNVGPAT
ncbi:MAG: penicillin acylase family protein, partial [Bdellovibrionota bacterium]